MTNRFRILPLALALALTGCNDMLTETPRDFLTTDSYYKTPADIEAATLSVYQPITRGDVWEWNMVLITELASDEVRIHPDEPNFGTYHPGLLLWEPTSGTIAGPWNGFYTSIYRANLVLARAPGVTFTNPQLQKELIAEAKFLRAYSYLNLTKLYGDVPLLLSEEDHTNFEVPRTPVADVHKQIVKDLTEAIADLPDQPRQQGRASKAAARMVLADLYQWRSSALKSGEWQKLAETAKAVIDDPNWGMLDNYINVFLPAYDGNKEVIWMVASSGKDGRTSTNTGCMWLPRALGFGSAGGCEVIGQPTKWFYDSWNRDDYRFQEMYRLSGWSTNTGLGDNGYVVFNWPNVYKYRPTNRGVGGANDADFPLYRYPEALLMYAEAQYEMGNVAEATKYVNLVRARARKGTGNENRAEPADLPTVDRDAIYMERAWEMAHEGKRWFDLIRRDALEPGYFVNSLMAHDPDSARGDVEEFRKLLPIPQGEMERNPALVQNPGY